MSDNIKLIMENWRRLVEGDGAVQKTILKEQGDPCAGISGTFRPSVTNRGAKHNAKLCSELGAKQMDCAVCVSAKEKLGEDDYTAAQSDDAGISARADARRRQLRAGHATGTTTTSGNIKWAPVPRNPKERAVAMLQASLIGSANGDPQVTMILDEVQNVEIPCQKNHPSGEHVCFVDGRLGPVTLRVLRDSRKHSWEYVGYHALEWQGDEIQYTGRGTVNATPGLIRIKFE